MTRITAGKAARALSLFMLVVFFFFCPRFGASAGEVLEKAGIPRIDQRWPVGGNNPFRFVVLGDKTSGGEDQWPVFDRAVEVINRLEPAFVITVGDHIPGHMEDRPQWDLEWAEYRGHAERIDAPLFFIPGNHDIANTACYQYWREDLGRTYYAFSFGGCLFLVLNTEEERFDGRGPVWERMMSFAGEMLDRNRQAGHTFLFFHKPMWDDPRFAGDWRRLTDMLGSRRYTAVAGHEHYLASEWRDGNLLVVQNATGAGVRESGVREIGCFHGVGLVTVTKAGVRYEIVEPDGNILPVDTAPMSFRKAVTFGMVQLDANTPEGLEQPSADVRALARLSNPLDSEVVLRLKIGPLDRSGWIPAVKEGDGWRLSHSAMETERRLAPGASLTLPLPFSVPRERLAWPPELSYDIQHSGRWLEKESFHMVEMDTVPLYPAAAWKSPGECRVAGPYALGEILTGHLPDAPEKANPRLFERLGPETGYAPGTDGTPWKTAIADANGLLNFNAVLGTVDCAAGFASAWISSPKAMATHAAVYADNFAQVYVNGELVEAAQVFGPPGGFAYVPVTLRAGWNNLSVKLINNRGDWFLRMLVADPGGVLKFAPAPGQP